MVYIAALWRGRTQENGTSMRFSSAGGRGVHTLYLTNGGLGAPANRNVPQSMEQKDSSRSRLFHSIEVPSLFDLIITVEVV